MVDTRRLISFSNMLVLVLAGALLLPTIGHAQEQSMTDRLRTQLRMTTQQLQSLQLEQAQTQAARATAEAQRDAALANVAQLEARLKRAQGSAKTLQTQKDVVQSQVRESRQQTAEVKQAYEELLVVARNTQTELTNLQVNLAERDSSLARCVAKNEHMYEVGKEMLRELEQVSTGSVLKLRQPFAANGRVMFEEMAQMYGDKLYSGQVHARDASEVVGQ